MDNIMRREVAKAYDLRAGRTVDLASATISGDVSMELDDFCEDLLAPRASLHSSLAPLRAIFNEIDDDDGEDADMVLSLLGDHGYFGYAIEFHTPRTDGSGNCDPTWGSTYPKWIYGNTIEEAWRHAVNWAAEMREHDRKRAKAKPKKGGAA